MKTHLIETHLMEKPRRYLLPLQRSKEKRLRFNPMQQSFFGEKIHAISSCKDQRFISAVWKSDKPNTNAVNPKEVPPPRSPHYLPYSLSTHSVSKSRTGKIDTGYRSKKCYSSALDKSISDTNTISCSHTILGLLCFTLDEISDVISVFSHADTGQQPTARHGRGTAQRTALAHNPAQRISMRA
ncbi:uncharacterized protein V6R79_024263 [Siganus canaliculatus]